MKLWHGQKYFADSVLQVTTTTSSSGIQSFSFVENTHSKSKQWFQEVLIQAKCQ